MSTGSNYANTSVASRPIIAPGAAAQSYYPITYASAAYDELASHRASPLALGTNGFARYGQRVDRALFPAISALKPAQLREALLNVLLVGGAVSAIVIMATIVLLVPYWLLFVGD